MNGQHTFDAPVRNPADDLLEIAPYARTLAHFIRSVQPPFTVGIYGEWGSGKSSFVGFVEHYLKHEPPPGAAPVRFISFTAWPYRTADELWRALILRIAEELYDAKPKPPAAAPDAAAVPPAEPPAPRSALRQFLTRDAIVLRPASPPPDPLAEYKSLLAQLDGTLHGGVAKSAAAAPQLDQEQLALTMARTLFTAVETMSPFVAGIRKLLGVKLDVDASSVVRRERNENTRARIESMSEFRRVFRQIFDDKAGGQQVCVFVDDLDRCMPDAALDVLEAIKVFLDDVPCVFIVAADENLIGQGLRLRFRDLLGGDVSAHTQALFTQKGTEYFEKIIQLGIRVPERTPEQTHTFIAAQFPQWLPATDIIQTAIGNNPRRLKQYCSLLRYKHMVGATMGKRTSPPGRAASPEVAQRRVATLDSLVALASWDRSALSRLATIAKDTELFAERVREIEAALVQHAAGAALDDVAATIGSDIARDLFRAAASSAPIGRLFATDPHFSELDPLEIATFARLTDVRPAVGATVLTSDDLTFTRIMESAARVGGMAPRRLLEEDFARLIELYREAPDVAPLVHEVTTASPHLMREIEQRLEEGTSGTMPPGVDAARKLTAWAHDDAPLPSGRPRREILLGRPRFSAMLPAAIAAFHDVRDTAIEETLPNVTSQNVAVAATDRHRRRARQALKALGHDVHLRLETEIELRAWAAEHFVDLRKFAKLDAFAHRWPFLARLLRSDRGGLIALEANALEPVDLPAALQRVWSEVEHDDALRHFFTLRPLFRDIYPDELSAFFAVSHAVSAAGEPKAAQMPGMTQNVGPIGHGVVAPPMLTQTVSEAILEREQQFTDMSIGFTEIDPAAAVAGVGRYVTMLQVGSDDPVEEETRIEWQELHDKAASLDIFARNVPRVTRELRRAGPDLAEQLRGVGEEMYGVLPGRVRDAFVRYLADGRSYRIAWQLTSESELVGLPWETVYVPELRLALALTQKYSIIRLMPPPIEQPQRQLRAPLRILAVLYSPPEAQLDVGAEREVLQRTLAAAEQEGRGQLLVLDGERASADQLLAALRTFRPNVFHFVGHGTFDQEHQHGAIVLSSNDGTRLLPADDLATLLRDYAVDIAVLNGCETGISSTTDSITGLAAALVHSGVPGVIATMRPIVDEAALLFAREFYRAFVDGYSLEFALAEARKALYLERWDWSAYALFAGKPHYAAFGLASAPTRKA